MYDNGHGVAQSHKAAAKWYRLAAKQGHAPAQTILAVMYGSGLGMGQDFKEAVKWYKLAAEQGYTPAQANLGVMYGTGQGVAQDSLYAHMWGDIAASDGNEGGRKLLDLMLIQMTPDQIGAAQVLSQKCIRKLFKGC